jgi:hypothetical protein
MAVPYIAQELAKRVVTNPNIVGPLLISAVGAQNADKIQQLFSSGDISFNDVFGILQGNLTSSILNEILDTPSGAVYAPSEQDIEAERKFNEELNKQVTLPTEVPIEQIISTPETTTKPEPLITPDVPEQKTKVEDVGFTESKQTLSDSIYTDVDIKDLTEYVGGINFPEEKTDNNLRLHTDRIKKLQEGKIESYPGAPQNERIVLKAPDETNLPDITIGKIEFDDWKNRIDSTMTKEEILESANWYKKIFQEFDSVGAGDKTERDKLATAWLAGQQNETPTSALTNVLFIYEQMQQGVPYSDIKGKGLPMANQVIKDIIFEKKVTQGVGQKISDFVDSGYDKNVRSIMGNDEAGGAPFVVDIHTARDMGLVDQTYLNKLKKLGYEIPDNIKIDISEGGITGTKYENRAMFGRELTDYLNSIEWQGKSDWKPAEIQAIGWMNLTGFTGELGTSGDVSMALTRNQRRISMEVAPGEGSPWEEQFSDDYSNLNISEQEKINNDVTAEAIKMVNEVFGTNLSGAVHGTGGWELYQNPSSVEQMFSSKENAKKAAAMLGYLLNQTEVWVNTAKELTKNPKNFGIDLVEDGTSNLRDSDTLKQFFEYFVANDPNGIFRGYQPIETIDGNDGIRIIVDNEAIKDSPLKKSDVLPYIQDFLENKFPEFTKDLDFSVQYTISEVELEKLRNDWKVDANGESYKGYFSDKAGTVSPLKSWSDIGDYLEKLTDFFESKIEAAKGKKVDKKRKGGYVMPLPKIDVL